MIDFPREPNPGENLDASWGARVVRALRALFPMPGHGINVSTGPSGTTISSAPADEEKQTKPPELFECRKMDVQGTPHLACYCPSGLSNEAVWLGEWHAAPLSTDRIAQGSPWLDLGAMPTSNVGVYLGFEDRGSSRAPRWGWRLYVLGTSDMFPSANITYFPAFPIAAIDGSHDSIVQLRTGAISTGETWFYPWENDLCIGLRLRGTNGSVLAVFNDTDSGAGGISAEFKGKVSVDGDTSVGGDLTLSGKLSVGNESYKPAWVTITIDGEQYIVLAKGRTRP